MSLKFGLLFIAVLSYIVCRMSLDDNHNSVVLACAKAIQCVLSCDMNNILFDISEVESFISGKMFSYYLSWVMSSSS